MQTKTKTQRMPEQQMRSLCQTALTSPDYCPTLSRPEQQADADEFDRRMAAVGSSKRAWRGIAPVCRASPYSEGARQVAEYEAECYRAGRNQRVARKGGLR